MAFTPFLIFHHRTVVQSNLQEYSGDRDHRASAERRRELAEKANDGALTSEEFADYEPYAQLRGLLASRGPNPRADYGFTIV
jgi:hypothetical protein